MTLYKEWQTLIENQTNDTFEKFWKEYSDAETRIYSSILDNPEEKLSGTIGGLSEKFQVRPIIFMGFLDGIDSSLKKSTGFEELSIDSDVELEIIPETLFFNMLKAQAEYLYSLPQWEDILGIEKIQDIVKDYKKSKTVVKEKKIGRNEPCPCGSGKKYKHCCGR